MLRGSFVLMLGAMTLAGCAVAPIPRQPPLAGYGAPPPRPPGPNIYTTAAPISVHYELMSCPWRGSNVGEIGARGESVTYTPYIETPAGPLLRDPTESACLSSGFGWRDSTSAGGRMHSGLDLANSSGGFIYAAGDGRVVSTAWRGGYGNTLEIDHGHGVHTLYAHLNEIDSNLAPGSFVRAGTAVARMGMTGNATGIHLHYEVTVDGLVVDPLFYGLPAPVTTLTTSDLNKPIN